MKKQKLLITGGAGGIGSVFVNSLGNNYKIDVVDNLHNGYRKNITNKNIKFIHADISNPNTYELLDGEYDSVFHFAAISSLPFCENNKAIAYEYNFKGTVLLVEYCRKNGIDNICFASTSAVYENNKEDLFTENLIVKPDLTYPLTKKFCEDYLLSIVENYNMTITILRFFNVFGSNQDIYRDNPPLLNYLVREFYYDRIPILHSNGTQARDYVYVNDLLPLFSKIINNPKKGIFNVCTGKLLSVNDILNYVSSYFNKSLDEVIWKNPDKLWDNYDELFYGKFSLNKNRVTKETLKYSLGDNSKLIQYFDWKPSLDFEKKIEETITECIKLLK